MFESMDGVRTFFATVARWFGVGTEKSRADAKGNLQADFGAIVVNGLFFPTAGKILGAGLLLAWFVGELTPSAFIASLIIPLQYGFALLGQPWIAQWMSGRAVRARYYRNQALVRCALWCALAAAAILLRESHAGWLLGVFFLVVTGDAIAAGVGNIAFSDALARVIPAPLRGRARGGRGMAGALLAGAAGIAIHLFVRPDSGLGVFALLFAVAGVCYALGGLTMGTIDEPPSRTKGRMEKHETLKARVREMLARPGYRRFLAVQVLLTPATQALVFFSLFGRREFSLDLKALGLLLVSDAAAPLIGNFAWGRWADRFGNAWVLRATAAVSLAAPVTGILLGLMGPQWPQAAVLGAFGLMVFTLGIASSGFDLASKNFVLELAPDEHRRTVYIGTNDTLIAVPTMLLAVGGVSVDRFGFASVFSGIAVCSIGALSVAFLGKTRARRNTA